MKNKRIDNVGFFIQCVLLGASIISLITTLFIRPLYVLTDGLISLLLLTLCYNNYKTYKRKYFTVAYFIIGIAWFIMTIKEVISGI